MGNCPLFPTISPTNKRVVKDSGEFAIKGYRYWFDTLKAIIAGSLAWVFLLILSPVIAITALKERFWGIRLAGAPAWEVERVRRGFPEFLRALTDLVPPGSVLYLESSRSQEIRTHLSGRVMEERGSWSRGFHLEITQENLDELAGLFKRSEGYAFLYYIRVYRDNVVLLEWVIDADYLPTNPLHIAKAVGQDKAREFCAKVGVRWRKVRGHRNRPQSR